MRKHLKCRKQLRFQATWERTEAEKKKKNQNIMKPKFNQSIQRKKKNQPMHSNY